MKNPLLIASRVGATVMAAVFMVNWLVAPGNLSLEHSREWDVDSHRFIERAGRVSLLLSNASGRRVKVNCEHYAGLCAHIKTEGTKKLRVWTDELGYFASTSLIQARVGELDVVSLQSQQSAYEERSLRRTIPLIVFLSLAILAWKWPAIARLIRTKRNIP